MIRINNSVLPILFLYVILPITLITTIIVLLIIIKKKQMNLKKKNMIFLKTIGIVFTIYSIYTLIWSILELIPLKKYNVLKESKISILLWIILPIIPTLITFIIWNNYKYIKEIGEENAKRISSN